MAQNANAPITIRIDVGAGRHPISPLVYGLNYAGDHAADLNCPVNRLGGNNTSRYNWKLNADNRGSDWFFQSIGDENPAPGGRIEAFVRGNRAAGTLSMVTVPLIGWVADLGPDRSKKWSFSVKKYGPQQKTDAEWCPDAGNGLRADGSPIEGNDPRDASVPADIAFMRLWIERVVRAFGTSARGGVRYWVLDNEPSLWHGTHRDVFPVGVKMEDLFARMRDTAAMIKAVDPTAKVVGPEEWGWSGYLYSGYDQWWGAKHGWNSLPDRSAHGGKDQVAYLLERFRDEEKRRGKRLLDVFTLHCYPQGGEFSRDVSEAMQLRRNRSTRALWDPGYKDESWINDVVRLIPRMKAWVTRHYPGTPIGLTEYNWGAEEHINGATAQADILGILGREGMDLATRWTTPDPKTPVYKAIKLYRNYDGKRGAFGDVSVSCVAPDPDRVSAFAAQRAKTRALTVMIVAKTLSGPTPVTLRLARFAPSGRAQAYQLTAANRIERLPDRRFERAALSLTVPAQSITLLVLGSG